LRFLIADMAITWIAWFSSEGDGTVCGITDERGEGRFEISGDGEEGWFEDAGLRAA
jgi:hypothetical protein